MYLYEVVIYLTKNAYYKIKRIFTLEFLHFISNVSKFP